jgi:hypothetical protein
VIGCLQQRLGQAVEVHKRRVCNPDCAAQLRPRAASRDVCAAVPRRSLATSSQKRPLHLAPGIRREGPFPGSRAPRGAHGHTRPARTRGRVTDMWGCRPQPGYQLGDKHHLHLDRAHLVPGHKHSALHHLGRVILAWPSRAS